MSSLSKATTFRVEKIEKHPNADALDIITVDGFPSIVKRGEYSVGEIAVFIPPDMVVPDTEEYAFLKGKRRIRAIKLRGVFSAGLVVKTPKISCDVEGIDVTEMMNIIPYEKTIRQIDQAKFAGQCERDPVGTIKYTDVESLRKYKDVLSIGEQVTISEKIHGANIRIYIDMDNVLHVGSRNNWLKEDETNSYWKAVRDSKIYQDMIPGYIYFGELVGVQDLRYGLTPQNPKLYIFDFYNVSGGYFVSQHNNEKNKDYDDYLNAEWIKLAFTGFKARSWNTAPFLYEGPWYGFETHKDLAEGLTTLPNANHVREGFVVKPLVERYDHKVGRVILKLHGEGYLTRK